MLPSEVSVYHSRLIAISVFVLAAGCKGPDLVLCSHAWDREANGENDWVKTYTYDEHGNITTIDEDMDVDGVVDRTITYTNELDADGRPLDVQIDYGTIQEQWLYTYDDAGDITRREHFFGDSVHEVTTFTYDAEGNMLTESWDYEADGVFDADWTYTYTFDDDELVLTRSRDEDGDGTPEQRLEYTRDDAGNITFEALYDVEDDSMYNSFTRTFDDDDRRTKEEADRNGDGTIDEVWTWTYGDGPDPLTASQDLDADGVVDNDNAYVWGTIEECNGEE